MMKLTIILTEEVKDFKILEHKHRRLSVLFKLEIQCNTFSVVQ